jgi:translocator protein
MSILALVGFIGLCLLVGAAGGSITARAISTWYAALRLPPGTPPNWVFAPVWTILYITLGTAAWLVWTHRGASRPLVVWGWQLAANAVWVPAFFGLHNPGLALWVSATILVLTAWTIWSFLRVRRVAAWLMLPYACWSLFAAYLNAGIWLLNRG